MQEVSSYEAKTHLPKVLRAAERGETIVITRHGKPIAKIVPIEADGQSQTRAAIEELRALRRTLPKAGITVDDIIAMKHEGHKY